LDDMNNITTYQATEPVPAGLALHVSVCRPGPVRTWIAAGTAAAVVLAVMVLDIVDGQIQTVRSVINPDKLEHLGPVADAWTVDQEYLEAKRAARPE
jgi:hypothetical protein